MMQCPKCDFEISDQAIYCTNCGAQIKITCSKCGAQIQAGASFCSQCGSRLNSEIFTSPESQKSILTPKDVQKQVDPYERRVVTILFADIVGSTTIAEHIDPEHLTEIMKDAYPCLLEPIQFYEGSIVQVMGDGVLAYFGAPLAREDDPERAVLAGLEIAARIKTYAKNLQHSKILDYFHVRVGINTGLVVVGEMNPEKHLEYIALGDAVNLAARLQTNAPEDGVLISQNTYQQIRGLFDVEPQPPLIVNGREQVERTFLVKGPKPYHLRIRKRGLDGIATTMIGREPEMAALKNYYRDAIQGGETALVLVSGDPGIGKTRLINEFASWVRSQPISPIMVRGRAITGTQNVPYGVLRYSFARSFGILESDASSQALEKFRQGTHEFIDSEQADLISQFVGFDFKVSTKVCQLMGSDNFGEIARLYLKNYFRNLAEKSLLIIMEDLHWMDEQTLDLISELVIEFSKEGGVQMMVLFTSRPQFFEERPKWGEGLSAFHRLPLRRLSRLQSRSLIDEILLGAVDIPEKFYQCIIDEAGGNPFFIEEMIKMFIDEDVITTKDDSISIRLDRLEDLHVPSTLKGILQARLDSLPTVEKQLLQRAAIIGRTFWDGLLKILINIEDESQEIVSKLEPLRDRGLIYQHERSSIAGHREYLFKHALLCDVAYETVLLKHRQSFHRRVAQWIEENSGDRLDEHLSLIAHHYHEGGQEDRAANWYIKAGERALKQCSMQDAKILFQRAIDLIGHQDLTRLWQATLGHDEAVGILGELDARHADDMSLLNLAQTLEDDELVAEAYYRIGSQAYREGSNQEAIQAFDFALGIAQQNDDVEAQAIILPMKISCLVSEGELQKAGSMVDEAMKLAHQVEDIETLAFALNNLALYYQAIGEFSQSVKLMQQQIDINRQQGNLLGETYGLINIGYFFLSLGQFNHANRFLERALTLSSRLGAKNLRAYSMLNLGLARWRLGNLHEAVEVLEKSLDILESLGDKRGLASRHFYLGLCYESANDLSSAASHYASAFDCFSKLKISPGVVEAIAGMARLAFKSDDLANAKAHVIKIKDYLDQEGSQALELPTLTFLTCVQIFDTSGDVEIVRQVLMKGLKDIEGQLDMIQEEDWKAAYRNNIPENRALMAFD